MSRSFTKLIEQAKKDTITGEQLFKDTEQFFKKNKELRNTLNGHSLSQETSRK